MPIRPDFQKRHFVTIAAAIRATRHLPHDNTQEAIGDLIETLCETFKRDNPQFRAETFRAACDTKANGHDFKKAEARR